MKDWFKQNASHIAVVAIFFVLVFFYFTPVWQGKTLSQHDVMQAAGSQQEIFTYKNKDGHAPQCTRSGMSIPIISQRISLHC